MTGIIFPKEHFQVYKDSKEDDKKLENRWLENLKRRKLKQSRRKIISNM